jgi:hypothetical protein
VAAQQLLIISAVYRNTSFQGMRSMNPESRDSGFMLMRAPE